MNWKTYRRLVRRLGFAIAVAAFAVPAAQAMPQVLYPDDLHGTVQVSSLPRSNVPTDSLGRPLPESVGPTDSLGRPLEPTDVVQPTSDVVSDSTGFDWAYVGIGFVALGLMSLVGGALIIGRHNRRSRLAAA